MQVQRSATSVSWIPSDSIPGLLKLPMEKGLMHYDPPPPLTITDLQAMRGRGSSGSQASRVPGSTWRTGRSATTDIPAGS
jgi:hypothetical protein